MNLEKIQKVLTYHFRQIKLLEQALTHRSYSRGSNYERLEFLGDSVLNLVITENIYLREPEASEGELSRIRASLVKQEALARVARDMDLGDYINLGGGELKSGGYRRSSILSDTLEAIIGAIYLDGGFDAARESTIALYRDYLHNLPDSTTLKDDKTRLQEYLQSKQIELPEYQVVKTVGKSHDQVFTVTCKVDSITLESTGKGLSRKKAEQDAAHRALQQLKL
ncbi:MAG: ribonuclease III [Gammaproteobacteria bacterium]